MQHCFALQKHFRNKLNWADCIRIVVGIANGEIVMGIRLHIIGIKMIRNEKVSFFLII